MNTSVVSDIRPFATGQTDLLIYLSSCLMSEYCDSPCEYSVFTQLRVSILPLRELIINPDSHRERHKQVGVLSIRRLFLFHAIWLAS